jgi:hypothetical protein
MIIYRVLAYCWGLKSLAIITLILSAFLTNNDDPGLPGGDPDLPNAPLDGGVYFFFAILLVYGIYKVRERNIAES